MIPGSDANALSANFPSSCDRAFNLSFIHSLAPSFLSPPLVPPDAGVDVLGPPNRASLDHLSILDLVFHLIFSLHV